MPGVPAARRGTRRPAVLAGSRCRLPNASIAHRCTLKELKRAQRGALESKRTACTRRNAGHGGLLPRSAARVWSLRCVDVGLWVRALPSPSSRGHRSTRCRYAQALRSTNERVAGIVSRDALDRAFVN